MDPVSRRLAAAAMGLAFGLSLDEELERTRLELERARMEREDFRNGGGPDTAFMHLEPRHFETPQHFERHYKYRTRPREEFQETARKAQKRSDDLAIIYENDMEIAVAALKRIASCGNLEAIIEASDALALLDGPVLRRFR